MDPTPARIDLGRLIDGAGGDFSHEDLHQLRQDFTRFMMSYRFGMDEIEALRAQHRSPLVARCIADHRAGVRSPLALLHRLLPDGRDA